MGERLIPLIGNIVTAAGIESVQQAAILGWYVPHSFTILEISWDGVHATGTGSGTTWTVDIQDDGSDITGATALSIAGASIRTQLAAPVRVAGGSRIEIDLTIDGGTNMQSDGVLTVWGYLGD